MQRTHFSASPEYGKELLNIPGWTVRSLSSPGGINLPELQTKYQSGDISECWASESVPSYENTSIPGNGVNAGHLLTVWSTCSPFLSNRNPHCESWEVRHVTSVSIFHPGSWASSHEWSQAIRYSQRELSEEEVMDAGSGKVGRSLQQQCALGLEGQ